MRNFNRYALLNFFTLLIFIMIIMFFYYLLDFKIWTYKSYTIIKINDLEYQVVVSLKDRSLFRDNNYLFLNNTKYIYDIMFEDNIKDNVLFTLQFSKKIKKGKDIETAIIQDTKKNIFSLIIESWREKWRN